nr:hypothetical protein [Streptomyces sp. FR-008]
MESAAETTGEYTFSADAWYTAEASSSGGVAPFSGGRSGGRGADEAGATRLARPARPARRTRPGTVRTGPPARSATGRLTGRATWGFPPRTGRATGRRGRRSRRRSRSVTTPPGRTPESVRPAKTTGVRSARIPSGRTRWTRTLRRTRPRTKPAWVRTARRTKKGTGRARARRRGVRPRPVRRCRRPTSTSRSRPVGWARAVPLWWPPTRRPRRRSPLRAEAPGTTCPRRRAGRGACWRS